MNIERKVIFTVVNVLGLIGVAGVLAILQYKYRGRNPWTNWEPRSDTQWCEADRQNDFMKEPADAWSTLSYLFVGLFIGTCGMFDTLIVADSPRNGITKHPIISVVHGFINCYHFLGTFMNHSCVCIIGFNLDVSGMYAVTSFTILYCLLGLLKRFAHLKISIGWVSVLQMILIPIYYYISTKIGDKLMAGIVILVVLSSAGYYYCNRTLMHLTLGVVATCLFLIGYAVWLLEVWHLFCFPNSFFQLHAVWHIFTSMAILFVYLFLRSENYMNWASTKPWTHHPSADRTEALSLVNEASAQL